MKYFISNTLVHSLNSCTAYWWDINASLRWPSQAILIRSCKFLCSFITWQYRKNVSIQTLPFSFGTVSQFEIILNISFSHKNLNWHFWRGKLLQKKYGILKQTCICVEGALNCYHCDWFIRLPVLGTFRPEFKTLPMWTLPFGKNSLVLKGFMSL